MEEKQSWCARYYREAMLVVMGIEVGAILYLCVIETLTYWRK